MKIPINSIKTESETQTRVKIHEETVTEYSEAMAAGAEFPPVVLFHDGTDYFMADGFHRILAAVRNEKTEILSDVRKGTRLDALIFALGANGTNGLRRSNADKRHCVEIALKEFPDWSNVRIEEACGVSDTFVAKIRSEVPTVGTCPDPSQSQAHRRTGKDGKSYLRRRYPSSATKNTRRARRDNQDLDEDQWISDINAVHELMCSSRSYRGIKRLLQSWDSEKRKEYAYQIEKLMGVFESWLVILNAG